MLKKSAILCFLFLSCFLSLPAQNPLKPVKINLLSEGVSTYKTGLYANPFTGNYRSILAVAPELDGLEGIRLPVDEAGNPKPIHIRFALENDAKLLIAVTPLRGDSITRRSQPELLGFDNKSISERPLLENAMSITELAAPDVYAIALGKGNHEIGIPQGLGFQVIIAGAIASGQTVKVRNAACADEENYPAFHIDGFADEPTLFSIIGGPDTPVVNVGMPGTEEIQGGFEGGSVVKIGGVYHMFPTERAGEPGVDRYYDRIKTRVGHWTSTDAIHWKRESTILQSSGVYATKEEDNPMNDRRAALWSYMPVFSKEHNRWYGFYLAYTCHPTIEPNHSFGRIWRCESEAEGIDGIGGPYRDTGIVIEPGLDSQLWEGRQGVASFFPYPVADGWHAFISGAYPFETRNDYPDKGGKKKKAWYVGLAESETLEGPWTRMDETINPVTSINPTFVENPIVSQLPNGLYIAVFDGGPAYLKLPNMLAYTLSKDGLNWSHARYLPVDTKVNRWWTTMRTPLCLIPEGDDIYTIIYTAWVNGRFNPIGMVRVKLDTEALTIITNNL